MKLILLSCLLFASSYVFAGTITGTVRDVKDSTGLVGVVITVNNTTRTAQTDIDGHFELHDLADGSYELNFTYVSYKKETKVVTLVGGQNVSLNFFMGATGNQLKGTTVRSNRVSRTETAVIQEIKASNSIVSGISAAQIGKTMDRNAADVVKRIPGVTIQDDRFITIRGLSERYNDVWLNDAGAPSSEVDKKAFSFDQIPSGLIERILIFKTPSPELPGDFAGGMVKIYTTAMPAKTEYTLNVQGSYRAQSTGTTFHYGETSSTDWLGYDNGSRNIPAGTPAYTGEGAPRGGFFNNDSNISNITKAFGNKWSIHEKKQAPDLRISLSASNLFKFNTWKLGNTFGLSYSNTSTNYQLTREDWDNTGNEQYHYIDQQAINKVNLAAMDNIAFAKGNTKIEFRNLYNQIGQTNVTTRVNMPDSLVALATDERAYLLGYENRKTYSTELSGSHHTDDNSRKYNWTLGYSNLERNQPDLRRIKYIQNLAGDSSTNSFYGRYVAQIGPGVDMVNGGGRYFARLSEHIYSFSHQFSQKISVGAYSFDASIGNYIEYKKRTFDAHEFGYTLKNASVDPAISVPSNWPLKYLPVDEIFADANVGSEYNFRMQDATSFYDHYYASNTLIASFLSLNLPVGDRAKIVGGARYEYNHQYIAGYQNLDSVTPTVNTKFLLPSANFTYNFTGKSLMRLAYGQTLNRPEFRESAPAYFYDFDLRAGTTGALFTHSFDDKGDTLDVARIHNMDARWELYPSVGELIQAGIFYKEFKNPIQQIIVPGSGSDSKSFTYANGEKAYVGGIEVDVRKNLAFLQKEVLGGWLRNFTLIGNLSLSQSQLTIDSARIKGVIAKGRLQNQSDYVVNAGVFYQTDTTGWQASLLYNVYGPRLYAVGTSDDPSIGELAFNSLDFTVGKTIAKHFIINVGVQNLLDQSVRYVEDVNLDNKFDSKNDKPYSTWRPGRYFTLGIKVRF